MNVYKYYSRTKILEEITSFLRNRWIAIHCEKRMEDGRPILLRYWKTIPLNVKSIGDTVKILKHFKSLRPRTFYGSANLYRRLETREDALDYLNNVYARTPTWDIDSRVKWWKETIEVGSIIVDFLEKEGLYNSVYLKWSGRGLHVHIHERAFSQEIYEKIHPIDLSYSIVEYVLEKVQSKIEKINLEKNVQIKVENLMDPQRVFTAPLSLHRELDISCVAFKPEDLDNFEIEWTNPANPVHDENWKEYEEGEGDELALKAFRRIGPYPKPSRPGRRRRKTRKIEEEVQELVFKEPVVTISPTILRYNPYPQPLTKRRDLTRSSSQLRELIEDALSLYVNGELEKEDLIIFLKHLKNIVIPALNYEEEVKQAYQYLCEEVINILLKLEGREEVKKWLLSHGPPRTFGFL
ncbi:MAG TPA: hypothetical protein ENF87_00490 [Thermoproteales archaeon]|nr:hypothetical protein [Thermoproteales archaeon]